MHISDVVSAIQQFADLSLQEKWDNCGLQVGDPEADCTGVILCLEASPAVVAEAARLKCNLIVSHHPLFFRPIKNITPQTLVGSIAFDAIKRGIAIYASHTASDSAVGGVSYILAQRLGIKPLAVLQEAGSNIANGSEGECAQTGLGIFGICDKERTAAEFTDFVKDTLGCKMIRTTKLDNGRDRIIRRVAMCGGAGHEFIDTAIEMGADAYITADLKYHEFVDYRDKILLIDAGHYETEIAITEKFRDIINKAYPQLPIHKFNINDNPINYV